MVKSTPIATINKSSGKGARNTLLKILTAEERGLQKFAIEFHDDARLDCRIPFGADDEHASPENSPMCDAQTDEREHDISLPFPKGDAVRLRS